MPEDYSAVSDADLNHLVAERERDELAAALEEARRDIDGLWFLSDSPVALWTQIAMTLSRLSDPSAILRAHDERLIAGKDRRIAELEVLDRELQRTIDSLKAESAALDQSSKPTYPVGVSVLITDKGRVLLGERKNNAASGLYSTPGGRVERADKDVIDTAIRETNEETGLWLDRADLEVIGFRKHFRFGQHYFMFYVHAPKHRGDLTNTEPEKCSGWEWFDLSNVPVNCTEPEDILDPLKGPSDQSAALDQYVAEKTKELRAVAAPQADAVRLDWLMPRLSGKALRACGVITAQGTPGAFREAIDAAMKQEATPDA